MEGEVSVWRRLAAGLFIVLAGASLWPASVGAQEPAGKTGREAPAQLELRRTIKSREYQGKPVDGEERVVRPRDTLWRILVVEKGLSEKRFARYVVLVATLNPGLKRPDSLQVGETLFIPIQPDEVLGLKPGAPAATATVEKPLATQVYEVKRGDQLFKVLRDQLGVVGGAAVRKAAAETKRLNPEVKNWDNLAAGTMLRLPAAAAGAPQSVAKSAEQPARIVGLDYGQKITAQENLDVLESVMKALGRETSREGEEAVPLREGTVHIDRGSYPIIQDARGAKVILDMQSKISAALRSKIESDAPGHPVVSLKKGASLHDAVNGILSRLGFQTLPASQPVVIQDSGVAIRVKGEWMVTTPEDKGAIAQVFVISLTDAPGQTPEYLKDYLARKGMNLKEIVLSSNSPAATPASSTGKSPAQLRIEKWPSEGAALVDTFLKDYGVNAAPPGQFSVTLRDGIRMDAKADRLFEYRGKKVAISFRPLGEDVKNALQQNEGLKVVELDFAKGSSREVIARLLSALGESAIYRDQRFQTNDRGAKDNVTVALPGYYLPQRSLLLTDREIPKELERFFADKGLRVVRF